jgi:hypothetical protein
MSAHQNAGESIYALIDVFLVRCPRCDRCARVVARPEDEALAWWLQRRLLVCTACGQTEDWSGGPITAGGACDWFFRLPLWLQAPCGSETLWAYNARHLDQLTRYLATNDHPSAASHLPRWLTATANRADMPHALTRLRQLLAEAG